MAVAADVLATLDAGLEPPRSAREAGTAPWHLGVDPDGLEAGLPAVVAAEAAAAGDGKLAVLVPAGRAERLAGRIATVVPAATASPWSGNARVWTPPTWPAGRWSRPT